MARTSPAGIRQLIAEEGEVLRAYRDVAGIWTIGVGLTKASGVVAPVSGMTISRAESARLLGLALSQRYEPAVVTAMPGASQAAFDGAVSFHFNTGAIGRASWVEAWRRGDLAGVRTGLAAWSKAGGRTVEGLVRRRAREADMIINAHYAEAADPASARSLSRGAAGEAVLELQRRLHGIGALAADPDGRYGPQTEAAVRRFQSGHPNLTVDGIAGPATQAELERAIATGKSLSGIAVGGMILATVPAAIEPAIPATSGLSGGLLMAAAIVAGIAALALACMAWCRRDEIRSLIHARRKS